MDAITTKTMAVINSAINARMPTMLVGSPGTGKTQLVKQIARERGYKLITLVGSRMDATDVTGLPKGELVGQDESGKDIFATVNLSPWWQVEILREKRVVLFLDEWGNSPGSVQAAFLTLLQDREFANGHVFPQETIVIGAMNPPEEGADSFEMALPTTNRIFWVSWNPSLDGWLQGMATAWGKDVSEEELRWKKKVAAFIKESPSWLHKLPQDAPTKEVYGLNPKDPSDMTVFRSAWPTRRSWDNLSRVLAEAPKDVYVQDSLASGIVGFAAAARFREWLRKNEDISVEEVIADPTTVDWTTISLNDANMILRSAVDMVTEENSLAVMDLFSHVARAGRASYGGPFMRDLLTRVTSSDFSREARKVNQARAVDLVTDYEAVSAQST